MIELERHIEILLLSNDCVIVPNLGGFMTHHVNARYDLGDGLFLPPLRTLGFNPQLTMNDSLLVQSYVEAYDISYPEALRRVEKEVEELRKHLETEGHYELNDIGVLHLLDDGRMEFEPCEAGILTPSLYGLSSFMMYPVDQEIITPISNTTQEPVKEEKQATEIENVAEIEVEQEQPARPIIDKDNDTIVLKMSWVRNAAAIAAAIIAFFMIQTPVSNSNVAVDPQQSTMLPIQGHQMAKAETAEKDVREETNQELARPEATSPVVSETPKRETTARDKVVISEPKAKSAKKEEAARKAEPKPTKEPVKEATPKKQSKSYTIVLASQTTEENAMDFLITLDSMGFSDNIHIVKTSKNGRVRVTYGPFNTEEEVYAELAKLRKHQLLKGSWVLRP